MPEETHKQFPPIALLAAIVILLAALCLVAFTSIRPPPAESTSAPAFVTIPTESVALFAEAAIVVDMQSGAVLYEKNADAQLPLASLTKVALALAASEALPSETILTIPYYAPGANGEALLKGERWPMQEIIDFMLLSSSNSAADILASAVNNEIRTRFAEAPQTEAALWRMNQLVKEIGLKHTYFLNVSGLDLSATQAGAYGSARDVALLFSYAASADPALFAGTAKGEMFLTSENGSRMAQNTNLAQGAIAGLILGKTGLTNLAGGNLAVVYDAGLGQPLVAVVLGSTEYGRFDDIQKLVSMSREVLAAE